MISDIGTIYGRVAGFVRDRPFIVALPFGCDLLRRGLTAFGAPSIAHGPVFAIGFTMASTSLMLIVMVCGLRHWRFEDNTAKFRQPSLRTLWGAAAMLAIQIADEVLLVSLGRLLAGLANGGHAYFHVGALLVWLFVSIVLFPWYVALLTEDRAVTLRASIAAIRPIWLSSFALVLGAIMPLLAIAMLLRIGMRFGVLVNWACNVADAALVPLLIVTTASGYFAIYRRAQRRMDPTGYRVA